MVLVLRDRAVQEAEEAVLVQKSSEAEKEQELLEQRQRQKSIPLPIQEAHLLGL